MGRRHSKRARKRRDRGERCGVRAFLRMCLCHPSASQIHHLLIPGHRHSVWFNKQQCSLSLLSVLQAFFTSQHDSMSKFTGCKPACEKKCEERESGQEGWGDDGVGSGSSCINEMLCDQDVAGNDNDAFVFWCSKYMMLTSSFQGKDTGL